MALARRWEIPCAVCCSALLKALLFPASALRASARVFPVPGVKERRCRDHPQPEELSAKLYCDSPKTVSINVKGRL